MTIGTRVDSNLGVVTTKDTQGFSVEKDTKNRGFSPYRVDSITAITASSTLLFGHAGLCTISGAGVLTTVLPLASNSPGVEFFFRSLSANSHIVTASAETAGTRPILSQLSSSSGTKITFGATVGTSVLLKSDGLNWHVLSFSGSIPITV